MQRHRLESASSRPARSRRRVCPDGPMIPIDAWLFRRNPRTNRVKNGGNASRYLPKNPFLSVGYAHEMAEWTGLEPATPGVTGRYSNQLNYHSEEIRYSNRSWWVLRGSNPRPSPCKGDALPAELSTRKTPRVYGILRWPAKRQAGSAGATRCPFAFEYIATARNGCQHDLLRRAHVPADPVSAWSGRRGRRRRHPDRRAPPAPPPPARPCRPAVSSGRSPAPGRSTSPAGCRGWT